MTGLQFWLWLSDFISDLVDTFVSLFSVFRQPISEYASSVPLVGGLLSDVLTSLGNPSVLTLMFGSFAFYIVYVLVKWFLGILP